MDNCLSSTLILPLIDSILSSIREEILKSIIQLEIFNSDKLVGSKTPNNIIINGLYCHLEYECQQKEYIGILFPFINNLQWVGKSFQIILKRRIGNEENFSFEKIFSLENSSYRIVTMPDFKWCFIEIKLGDTIVPLKVSSELKTRYDEDSEPSNVSLYFIREENTNLKVFEIKKSFPSFKHTTTCVCQHRHPAQFFPFILSFDSTVNKCCIYGIISESKRTPSQYNCLRINQIVIDIDQNIGENSHTFEKAIKFYV